MNQKQRANHWLAICMLYPGGEKALSKQLYEIAVELKEAQAKNEAKLKEKNT